MFSVAVLGLVLASNTDDGALKSYVAVGGRYTLFGTPPLELYSIIPDPDEDDRRFDAVANCEIDNAVYKTLAVSFNFADHWAVGAVIDFDDVESALARIAGTLGWRTWGVRYEQGKIQGRFELTEESTWPDALLMGTEFSHTYRRVALFKEIITNDDAGMQVGLAYQYHATPGAVHVYSPRAVVSGDGAFIYREAGYFVPDLQYHNGGVWFSNGTLSRVVKGYNPVMGIDFAPPGSTSRNKGGVALDMDIYMGASFVSLSDEAKTKLDEAQPGITSRTETMFMMSLSGRALIYLAGEIAEGWRMGGAVGYEVRMQMMAGDDNDSARATELTARFTSPGINHFFHGPYGEVGLYF